MKLKHLNKKQRDVSKFYSLILYQPQKNTLKIKKITDETVKFRNVLPSLI